MNAAASWADRSDTLCVAPGDTAFWQGLWRTREFRALLTDPGSGYGQVLAWAATRPWWFVSARQSYERRHFGVWFGQAFVRRDYDNPLITDLFHWHDLLHAYTFDNGPLRDETHWRRVMRANEIAVSLETEILIYWRAPGLRAQSFDFPIWADHLGSPLPVSLRERRLRWMVDAEGARCAEEGALWQARGDWPLMHPAEPGADRLGERDLWAMRRAVTRWPDRDDPVEAMLADYEAQAQPFYSAWAGWWREVETERRAFDRACAQGHWREAVARREALWRARADAQGVPYGAVAQALAEPGAA